MSLKQLQFSVSRPDLVYDFAGDLKEIFSFAVLNADEPLPKEGVRFSENYGYDFQQECSPVVRILPLSEELIQTIGINSENLQINVQIEDPNLVIRKSAFSIPAVELDEPRLVNLNLSAQAEMSFLRGFEVKCFLSRISSGSENDGAIWHKSQIVHQKNFVVKAAVDEALFQLTWVDFQDEHDKEDLLYFIEWASSEVSTEVDTRCFQVNANNRLKDQIKRLRTIDNSVHLAFV